MKRLRRPTTNTVYLAGGMPRGCPFLLVAATLLLTGTSASGLDYELLGSVRGTLSYHYLGEAEQEHRLTAESSLEATHRLLGEQAELKAVTSYRADSRAGDSYGISEASATLFPLAPLSLTLGKLKLGWGTTNRFAPSDSLHERPGGEQEAFIGGAATYAPTADVGVTAAISLDETLQRQEEPIGATLTGALLANAYFGNVELVPSLVYRFEETLRPAIGASVRIAGLILYGEGAVELWNDRLYPDPDRIGPGGVPELEEAELGEPYPLLAAGVTRTFAIGPVDLSLAAEYLFAATGYTEDESEALLALMDEAGEGASVPGGFSPPDDAQSVFEPRYWSRHYVYGTLALSRRNLGSIENSITVNAQDGSVALGHEVVASVIDSVDLSLRASWFAGESGETEFGTLPGADELPGRFRLAIASTLYF